MYAYIEGIALRIFNRTLNVIPDSLQILMWLIAVRNVCTSDYECVPNHCSHNISSFFLSANNHHIVTYHQPEMYY